MPEPEPEYEVIFGNWSILHDQVDVDERLAKLIDEGYGAEEHFGLPQDVLRGLGYELLEDSIPVDDPNDYTNGICEIPAGDCDGVDTCWRTYIRRSGDYLVALVFTDKAVKILNEIGMYEYSLGVFVLRRKRPAANQ